MGAESSRSLPRIYTIARNAFREAVRDRILYNLIVFVLMITAAAILLGDLTGGQESRVIVNLGLAAIRIFGAFIAIFVGVSLVWKEIEKKTVYAIFAKPVGRGEFVIGKYLGLSATLLVNTLIMGVGVSLALLFVGDRVLAANVWPAITLIYFELTIITAVAILFSSFSTPALSAMLTFLVFLIGHFSKTIRELADGMATSAGKYIIAAIYYGLPNFSHFTFTTETANGMTVPPAMLGFAAIYTVAINMALLAITTLIFSRRNFK